MDLSIGVLTAPRPFPTLDLTIAELRHGGFHQTLHIFAEPDSPVEDWPNITVHRNAQKLGMWHNWRNAAETLLLTTESRFILLCEDDLLVAPDAAAVLQEAMLTLPLETWGVASLYTSIHNVQGLTPHQGWNDMQYVSSLWGSLAYCFTRESLSDLLHAAPVLLHHGDEGTDYVVSANIKRLGRTFLSHVPSLCAHTGGGNSSVLHGDCDGFSAVDFATHYRDNTPLDDVTLIVKTFERPDCLQRFMTSLRKYYPTLPVIIADDSRDPYAMAFSDEYSTVVELPFDSGVSVGRNEALKRCRTPYFILCDDDHHFDSRTTLEILRRDIQRHDLDVLGGEVMAPSSNGIFCRPFEYNLNITWDSPDEMRTEQIPRTSQLTRCDIVSNFFIARTDSIRDRLDGWDDDLKILEHVEFFVRAKQRNLRTAYTPHVSINHPRTTNELYNQFRRRNAEFTALWMTKHRLRKFTRHDGSFERNPLNLSSPPPYRQKRKSFEDNIRILNDTLQKTPLAGHYWLGFGALLGYRREGSLLSHDPDIDFGIFDTDLQRFHDSVDALLAAGFRKKYRWTNSLGKATEYSFDKDGAKFEFFVHFVDPAARSMQWYLYNPAAKIEYHREQSHYDLEEIAFLDRIWLAPRDIDSYLSDLYGDWQTPDPGFLEDMRPCTIRRIHWSGTSRWQ